MALLNEHIDGKYEILGKLREGGMGAIYKVRHRLLDEVRVVKVIRSQTDAPAEGADRFQREAKAAIRLRHPNIAVLHDFAVTGDGQAFIVMEYIDGWNLLEVLNAYGPPPVPLTLEIARQSLRALGYLHRHRIVHRDVSPDNLMLTRDIDGNPQVKLIDLGIAKALEGPGGLTTTGIFLGKPRYGSPERFSGGAWDARSDLYSFGVVLYELLTGRCPISGGDPAALMAGHLFRPPLDFAETDPQGRVPPELRSVVLRALAKKPEDRMASAEDFLWELTLLQDGLPLTPEELQGVWKVLLPLSPGSAPKGESPGSTQHRLNLEFMLGKTPPAGVLTGESTLRTTAEGALAEIVPFPASDQLPRAHGLADPALPRRVGDGRDLDATWASRPLRVEPRPAVPVQPQRPAPAPLSPRQGVAVARPSRAWIAWTAGAVVVLAVAAAGYWQRRRSEPAVPEAPPPAVASAAPLPLTEIAEAPGASPPPVAKPEPAVPPKPSPARAEPSPPRLRSKPQEPVPAPPPLAPMELGALIQPRQPGVEPPEILELPSFGYPEVARGSGKKLSVEVAVLVNEAGDVISAEVRSGEDSDPVFDQAALEAARRTRFHPPRRDGVAGKMWTELRFDFAE